MSDPCTNPFGAKGAIWYNGDMKCTILLMALFILSLMPLALGQPGLNVAMRKMVYRVVVPVEEQSGKLILKEATGIMLLRTDSNLDKFIFLVLNKHAVVTDTVDGVEQYADSLFLFNNHSTSRGEVLSGPDHHTVYLKKSESLLLPSHDVDVVLIALSTVYSDMKKGTNFVGLDYGTIVSADRLPAILETGQLLTVIGYPGKGDAIQSRRSPEYRWGHILDHDSLSVWSDAPLIPGSSGSICFASRNGVYVAVGIHDFNRYSGPPNAITVRAHFIPITWIVDEFDMDMKSFHRIKSD